MVSPTDQEQDLENQEDSSTSNESDTSKAEDSSNSKTSEEESSTFDVVMNAINPEEDDNEGESESNSDEDDKTDDKSDDEDGKSKSDDEAEELSDNDFEDLSPEARKHLKKETGERFDKLKGLYRESKEQVAELTTRLEQSEVGAGHYKQFSDFLETNRISSDEANELFSIGALMKNDPVKALEVLTPHYNNLLQATGNVLSPDLKQQVDQGYITKEHALEISRHRANSHNTQAIQQDQQQHQQTQQVNRQQEQASSINNAIANWEQQWSSSDVNYSVMKDSVLDRVELDLVRAQKEGKLPQTVEQAIELANNAKAKVEAEYRRNKPKKAVNTVDGGKAHKAVAEPKTTLDVVRGALN